MRSFGTWLLSVIQSRIVLVPLALVGAFVLLVEAYRIVGWLAHHVSMYVR